MQHSNEWQVEKAMESLVAESYKELPHAEANELFYELHGVVDMFPETPELIAERLEGLEIELQKITMKPAYDIATVDVTGVRPRQGFTTNVLTS